MAVREMDGNGKKRKREEVRGGERKVEGKKEREGGGRERKETPTVGSHPHVRHPENTLLLLHDGWFTRTCMEVPNGTCAMVAYFCTDCIQVPIGIVCLLRNIL